MMGSGMNSDTPEANYCILGRKYSGDEELNECTLVKRINELIQMTYRTRFEPILMESDGPSPLNIKNLIRDNLYNSLENIIFNSKYFTSDIGWGCMIRTGQTLLANALYRSALDDKNYIMDKTIELFLDESQHPFSIHNFISIGKQLNLVKVGEWFSPSITIQIIEKLIEKNPIFGIKKCIISISSGDIYEQEIIDELNEGNSHILLLFGIKLGINTINVAQYGKDIKMIMNNKFSCGISGGQPKSSLFFFGYNNKTDRLLYFNPHISNKNVIDQDYTSYHTTQYHELDINELDPSMIMGFLIKDTKKDWCMFKRQMEISNIINVLPGRRTDSPYIEREHLDEEEYIIV